MKKSEYTLKCNYHVRDKVYWWDLTDKERKWFDYVEDPDWFEGFRYRGEVYDLGEFARASSDVLAMGFDGMMSESAFSAVVVGYFDKDGYEYGDGVVVGYLHW